MQRSYPLRLLALGFGLLGTQCLDSLSDDCNETLTCENEPTPQLNALCQWVDQNGRPWAGPAPVRYDQATGLWILPDGRQSMTPDFGCRPGAGLDAGADASGPSCDADRPCDEPFICHEGSCVECVESEHCASRGPVGDAGVAPVCDTARNECVACLEHGDCSGETPFCKTDANTDLNECVECTQDSECPPDSPVCDQRNNECTSRCTSAEQCGGNKPVCNLAEQLCVECTENATCSAPTPQCNTETNDCVECVDDAPCSAAGEVCDTASNLCVQCREDLQCNGHPNGPRCDPETKLCVQCLNDAQCGDPALSRCNLGTKQCVGCNSSAQCENGFVCNTGSGACVQCLTSDQCTDPLAPVCETAAGRCVACLSSEQCTSSADATRCELAPGATQYTCQGCQGSGDCLGKGFGLICDEDDGVCVDCETPGDCAGNDLLSRCVLAGAQRGECVACAGDGDCAVTESGNRACLLGQGCVECTSDTHCVGNPDGPVCKTSNGGAAQGPASVNTCVECTSNANCTGAAASRCANNGCQACTADADCSHLPGLGVCDAGTCVQCTAAKREACGNFVCNGLTRQCTTRQVGSAALCAECVSDAECAVNARCVRQTLNGQQLDQLGFFCFPLATGETPSCAGQRIYFGPVVAATIDGQQPAPTTCQPRQTTCAGLGSVSDSCDDDDDCGAPGIADGICNQQLDQCTYACASANDCLQDCDFNVAIGTCTL